MRFFRHRPFVLFLGILASALPALAQTGPFQGSASAGPPSAQPLSLSLDEALKKGLRYNLGAIDAAEASDRAKGEDIVARSVLYPNLSGVLRENVQQIDLASYGFKFKFPPALGVHFPNIVGPFNFIDLRAYLTQKVADLQSIRTYQSSRESQRAAELSAVDAREIVVYVVTSAYLQTLAEAARVDSAKVQVDSAQAIYQQASDRFSAGLSAKIDMTRSQVELETQQQRLTAEQAEFAKEKIGLARLIGLSPGQEYSLSDKMPYAPLDNMTLDQALVLAAQNRSDLKAAEAQLHSAEFARKAAFAEHLPTLSIVADYGVIGINPANSHGTFDVSGQLNFPIWAGGHTHGDIVEADANLTQRRAEFESTRSRVEADVRNAYLDLNAAAELVRVAQSRRDLARDELTQSSDRFASGVADTVEVTQAQEVVASAESDYISDLNAHNLAKASVARAIGQAEKIMRDLLRSQ
ncbi:MAG TPA: TolC family protein [Verrucomicrobiae bacterium]|jgi:outer membrane protein TolC|nr:TolC family protein [Verrucomicrobiae bacterium]